MKDDTEATDAEIAATLKSLDKFDGDLFKDAAQCIRWLQSGVGAAELDCEVKRGAIEALTEGRGLPDDDLWAAMKKERDQAVMLLPALTAEVENLKALNEDKFRTIQAYCKAASEDKAVVKRALRVVKEVRDDDSNPLPLAASAKLNELAIYLGEVVDS